MDIKFRTNPYYFIAPSPMEATHFRGVKNSSRVAERVCDRIVSGVRSGLNAGVCEDKFVRRPVASKSATGLLGLVNRCKKFLSAYLENYKKNIRHTFDHKVVFALVEKELYGANSIDSVTHDLDKLILYSLGFPKPVVTKLHRKISEHHVESGKKNNLRSMLCDNIASSPEFKPEKKKSLRDYYNSCKELQNIEGFSQMLEKYNYGENLDFNAIKQEKNIKFNSCNGIAIALLNVLTFIYSNAKTSRL